MSFSRFSNPLNDEADIEAMQEREAEAADAWRDQAVDREREAAEWPVFKDGQKVADIKIDTEKAKAEWRKNNPFPNGRW